MTLVNLCIVMASFMLQGRSEKLTESLWPRKPKKKLLSGPLRKNLLVPDLVPAFSTMLNFQDFSTLTLQSGSVPRSSNVKLG